MEAQANRLVHYDATRRRLWVAGQRCHHGATGVLLACFAAAGLAARLHLAGTVALLATGTLLMADDWDDRSVWFQKGWQDQP